MVLCLVVVRSSGKSFVERENEGLLQLYQLIPTALPQKMKQGFIFRRELGVKVIRLI